MHKQNGQSQARLTLLTIDDEVDCYRYRQTIITEPNCEAYLESGFHDRSRRKSGKENQIFKKQYLPKLNSSKEELKLILRRLQADDFTNNSSVCHDRTLQPLRSYQNQPIGKGTGMKSFRQEVNQNIVRELYTNKYTRKAGKGNEPRSQLSFMDSRAEDIQFLMRKNNYSANALNLKTLNILHEINTKNSRCCSSIKKRGKGKVPECIKPTKKKMVAFLRKVA